MARVKECDDLIHRYAEISCKYWLDDSSNGKPAAQNSPDRIRIEAEIISAQIRISGHLDLLSDRLSPSDIKNINKICGDYFNAMTGGNFMSKRVRIEPDMARQVYSSAADFSNELKRRSRDALTILGTVFFVGRKISSASKIFWP